MAILCIGTDNAPHHGGDHILGRMFGGGLIVRDSLGLGLATDKVGRCLTDDGSIVPNLYAMDPLRRGTLWENIAVPEF